MPENDYSKELEELEEELKQQLNTDSGSYGSPSKKEEDSLFKFFREILDKQDSTRIGNLREKELGLVKMGVRDYQELACYAEAEGLDLVSSYLMDLSHIITSTSMSKKGFWSSLFVTRIKKEQKTKETEKKGGLFSRKVEE